jgi:hypothetical protein
VHSNVDDDGSTVGDVENTEAHSILPLAKTKMNKNARGSGARTISKASKVAEYTAKDL